MANEQLERLRHHVDPHWSRSKVERELDAIEQRVSNSRSRRFYLASAVAMASATLAVIMGTRSGEPVSAPRAASSSIEAAERSPHSPEPRPEEIASPGAEDEAAPEAALAIAEPAFDDASVAQADEHTPRKQRGKKARRHRQPNRVKETQSRVVVAGQAWQSLAREGRYHEAYLALSEVGLDRQNSAIEDLLLAGDAARLSGHAREAVPYYRDALARAGKGPRAHLSAFTLGRTLLHDLKDARGAAGAFEKAYAAAPKGPLAEEALAGQADSWTRLGDRERARSAAARYLEAFPHGRRAKDMERVAKGP